MKEKVLELTQDELKAMIAESVGEALPVFKEDMAKEISQKVISETKEVSNEEKVEKSADFIKGICLGDEEKVAEYKAVDTGSSSFGYSIPTELADAILEKRDTLAHMRKRAFVFKMSGEFQLPTEGTMVTAYWVDDNAQITESNPTVGRKTLHDYYLAVRVLIPRKLLNTSAVNIVQFLSNLAGRKIALTEETAFVGGDGSTKATGFRSATVGSVAQAGASLVRSDVLNLFYALPAQYRANAVFATSTAGMKLLDSLVATDGKPLFDINSGKLKGKDVLEMADIPSNLGAGTDETEIWFFDPFYYWIKDGEEMFAETDKVISKLQVELVVAEAVDGIVVNEDAFKKLTAVK